MLTFTTMNNTSTYTTFHFSFKKLLSFGSLIINKNQFNLQLYGTVFQEHSSMKTLS